MKYRMGAFRVLSVLLLLLIGVLIFPKQSWAPVTYYKVSQIPPVVIRSIHGGAVVKTAYAPAGTEPTFTASAVVPLVCKDAGMVMTTNNYTSGTSPYLATGHIVTGADAYATRYGGVMGAAHYVRFSVYNAGANTVGFYVTLKSGSTVASYSATDAITAPSAATNTLSMGADSTTAVLSLGRGATGYVDLIFACSTGQCGAAYSLNGAAAVSISGHSSLFAESTITAAVPAPSEAVCNKMETFTLLETKTDTDLYGLRVNMDTWVDRFYGAVTRSITSPVHFDLNGGSLY